MNTTNTLMKTKEERCTNIEIKEKPMIVQKKSLKRLKFIIIISSIAFLLAIAIVFTIIFIKRNNNRKNEDQIQRGNDKNENSNPDIISSNLLTAKYYLEEGKNITLLDPTLIGLKNDDYYIEILEKDGNLRNLNSITSLTISGKEEGILTVNLKFRDNLKSMFGMFKGCENLIDIDFSNLNTSKLEIMNSLFEGCNHLENVNFFNIKLDKIRETENLFKDCENLIQIKNLDKINMPNVRKANNMFKNCKSIRYINLSNLYIEKTENMKDIFYGCDKLEILDISNFKEINNDLFGNLIDLSKIKIKIKKNVTIANNIKINKVEDEDDFQIKDNCEIGENEKCKECDNVKEKSKYCKKCNEGYYLPKDKNYNIECKKCEKNCLKCEGFSKNNKCLKCKEGFEIIKDKCVKECIKGEKERCKICGENENRGKCIKCNEGYYLKNNISENYCENCELYNCKECKEDLDKNDVICNSCQEGYILIENM